MPHTLYACVLEARGYIVGSANAGAGVYRRDGEGWTHLGWGNIRGFGMAVDPHDRDVLYLAAGNGVVRSRDAGRTWRVTTDWAVAEVLDVLPLPHRPGHLLAATAFGVWATPDGGETWQPSGAGIRDPQDTYVQALAADAGRVLAGTEGGLYVSEDDGASWSPLGPRGVAVRALAVQPGGVRLAGTEDRGLLRSEDGAHWAFVDGPPAGTTIYAVAFDPAQPERAAAAGFGRDLFVSDDGGRSWTRRTLPIEARAVHALAFDPDAAARLWIGSVGYGLYVTDDLGATCREAGLAETTLYDLLFVPSEP